MDRTPWVLRVVLCMVWVGCGDDGAEPDGGALDAGGDAALDAADAGSDAGPGCPWDGTEAEAIPDPARYTPRWAFEPWISKDISDRADTEAFVTGFLDRDIPVGAVVIDSPWETNYNSLIPNEARYGDFAGLVQWLHERDVRIVLWTTQMVNSRSFDFEEGGDVYRGPSPNYREAQACGFFVNGGQTYGWWKGRGGAVDFFHPQAVAWWRRQQDLVLDMGVDGWKLDFGESYIRDTPNSYAEVVAFDGVHTVEEYGQAYYADFLRYGVHKRGREFVTMVRGYDVSYDIPARFYARPEHAPVVWMGDNERSWEGLVDALDHAFRSARAGYVAVGWDIGGYLDLDEMDFTPIPFDRENFLRWTGVSAFMPFFQLHGRANLEPWNIEPSAETTAVYRYWATLHSELVPFWYSLAQQAYGGGPNIIRPVGEEADWAGDWRFEVGDAFLVAPILEAGGVRDVELPPGVFFDWWDPDATPIAGGVTLRDYDATDIGRIPVFVREGAIVPMTVRGDATGHGAGAVSGARTVLVWGGSEETTFTLWEDDDTTTTIRAQGGMVTFARTTAPTILRMRQVVPAGGALGGVRVDGASVPERRTREEFVAAADGYWRQGGYVWVHVGASSEESRVELLAAP